MELGKSKSVHASITVRINGITEEELFDAVIDELRSKFGKNFKISVCGKYKEIAEKHIL